MEERKKPILELENVSKTYRRKLSFFGKAEKDLVALDRISLQILKGEIFGLVGESGSGKTTAGRLIVKLEEAEEGRIQLEDVEITHLEGKKLKEFRRRVQMIFQDPYQSLNPQISIYDAVCEPLIIHKVGDSLSRREMVEGAMKSAGLTPPGDFFYRYPHQLSGGQRQRAAIARAMVLKPEFVVADEPTSMLDASISAQIFNILLEMRDRLDVTLLFITHSLAAARYLCDRIGVIYRGNLMEVGPADQVIRNPRHPYTQALIDALPKFGHCGEEKRYDTLLRVDGDAPESAGCCPFYPRCKVSHRIRCSREKPTLRQLAPSHWVACFYVKAEGEFLPESDQCFYGT